MNLISENKSQGLNNSKNKSQMIQEKEHVAKPLNIERTEGGKTLKRQGSNGSISTNTVTQHC